MTPGSNRQATVTACLGRPLQAVWSRTEQCHSAVAGWDGGRGEDEPTARSRLGRCGTTVRDERLTDFRQDGMEMRLQQAVLVSASRQRGGTLVPGLVLYAIWTLQLCEFEGMWDIAVRPRSSRNRIATVMVEGDDAMRPAQVQGGRQFRT